MKQLLNIIRNDSAHWVGDGFPVRTVFSYHGLGQRISPFLLLDYAGPAEFPPSSQARGVGEHPHRGFETVTLVYQGELEHRDSAGNHGTIGPGDVQWMTAASGVVHEEMHSAAFTRTGGILEMVQLWVNLPASVKMSPPRYQSLLNDTIPVAHLANGAGRLRVIAGEYEGTHGVAQTFTPINLYDLRLKSSPPVTLTVPDGYTTGIFVLNGTIRVNGTAMAKAADLALFDPKGEQVSVEAGEEATLLILNGQPMDEPVVGHGPFVMNTQDEIRQAIRDYQDGKMGRLAARLSGEQN